MSAIILISSFGISGDDLSSLELLNSPTETIAYNLPIVEHNVAASTPVPNDGYPVPETVIPVEPGTPTPTPIPVQTGSENLPIVIGALAIIIVILLAWFFIGFLPSRIEGKPS